MTYTQNFSNKLVLEHTISAALSIKSNMYIFMLTNVIQYRCNWVTASFIKQNTTLKANFDFLLILMISLPSYEAKNVYLKSLIHSHRSLETIEFYNLFLSYNIITSRKPVLPFFLFLTFVSVLSTPS